MRAVLLCAACLAFTATLQAGEIATGSMLGPRYEPEHFYIRKSATEWEETYRAATYQRRARGKLLAVRASQGLFEDEWLSEQTFDANANTDALIAALDFYKAHGFLAVSVSLQGADPGYSPERNGISRHSSAIYGQKDGAHISAFESDGTLKQAWIERLGKLLNAADKRGMFVKLTYFHPAQDETLESPEAVVEATRNITKWLVAGEHRNVIIDVATGWDVQGAWDHFDFIPRNIANLVSVIREQFNGASFSLPIGASSGPSMLYPSSLAQVCDVVLLDGTGMNADSVSRRLDPMSDYDRPLWIMADVDRDMAGAAALFSKAAGWTYNPRNLTQYFPFAYQAGSKQEGSAEFHALMRHIAALVLKKPPLDADTE